MAVTVKFSVNGTEASVTTDGERRLLDVLREELHLTGTKYGCGEGQCGACLVYLDGEPTRSCLLPVTAAHRKSVTTIEGLLPEFERAGVVLAIENHDRFKARTLAGMLERLGSEHVGICLDTVNSFGALEGPEVVVDVLGPWTVNLHVKDFAIFRAGHLMGFTVEGRPAGQGRLDVPWLLQKLHELGRDPNAIIDPVKREVKALKDIGIGEAVTVDYAHTEDRLVKQFACMCGSSHCRRWIKGRKEEIIPEGREYLDRLETG